MTRRTLDYLAAARRRGERIARGSRRRSQANDVLLTEYVLETQRRLNTKQAEFEVTPAPPGASDPGGT
jgi:hypothetical protein